MQKHEIKEIFFIKDKGLILIHLKGYNWDFRNFDIVFLCYDNQRIRMLYTGFGNHEGNATLSLRLDDSRYNSISEVESEIKKYNKDYFLES